MSDIITTTVTIDSEAIQNKIENLIDDTVMLQIHNEFAKLLYPYVPFDTGSLRDSSFANVTPQYVRYATEYAHYMYEGVIYGPNFPIKDKQGNIIGWRSPIGEGSKHNTRRPIEYHKNPKATHHWDEAMMREQKDVFLKKVQEILKRRAKQLYG